MSRQSFHQWLMKKHKVVGVSENLNKFDDLKHTAGVNFLFANDADAKACAAAFGVAASNSRMAAFNEHSAVFKDDLDPSKFAIYLSEKSYDAARAQFEKENLQSPPTAIQIRKQLQHLEQVKATLTREVAVNKSGHERQALAKRLDELKELATNRQEGARTFEVISAYQLALRTYIAYHYNSLAPDEVSRLQQDCDLLMVGDDVGTGLKGDTNWWDQQRHYTRDANALAALTLEDAKHHVYGVKNRIKVTRSTPNDAPLTADAKAALDKHHSEVQDIPAFFSDPHAKPIVIQSGGMNGHHTVTRFWKEGVDQKGIAVADPTKAHHFKYYRTVHNGGAELTWHQAPQFNPKTSAMTTGTAVATATYEITPNGKTTENEKELADALVKLIQAERMITCWDRPAEAIASAAAGLPSGHSAADSPAAAEWHKWRDVIANNISGIILGKSRIDRPQVSGNCTAMSTKIFLIGIGPQFDAHSMLHEDVWLSIKKFGANFLDMIHAKMKTAYPQWESLAPIDKVFASLELGLTDEALHIAAGNPATVNQLNSHGYLYTMMAMRKAYHATTAEENKKYLDFIKKVIGIHGFNINKQQHNKSTLLHLVAWFASEGKLDNKECKWRKEFQQFATYVMAQLLTPKPDATIKNQNQVAVCNDAECQWFRINLLHQSLDLKTAGGTAPATDLGDVKAPGGGGAAASGVKSPPHHSAVNSKTGGSAALFKKKVKDDGMMPLESDGEAPTPAPKAQDVDAKSITTAVHTAKCAYAKWYEENKACSNTIGWVHWHDENGQRRALNLNDNITRIITSNLNSGLLVAAATQQSMPYNPNAALPEILAALRTHLTSTRAFRTNSFNNFLLTAIRGSEPLAEYFGISYVALKTAGKITDEDLIPDDARENIKNRVLLKLQTSTAATASSALTATASAAP